MVYQMDSVLADFSPVPSDGLVLPLALADPLTAHEPLKGSAEGFTGRAVLAKRGVASFASIALRYCSYHYHACVPPSVPSRHCRRKVSSTCLSCHASLAVLARSRCHLLVDLILIVLGVLVSHTGPRPRVPWAPSSRTMSMYGHIP